MQAPPPIGASHSLAEQRVHHSVGPVWLRLCLTSWQLQATRVTQAGHKYCCAVPTCPRQPGPPSWAGLSPSGTELSQESGHPCASCRPRPARQPGTGAGQSACVCTSSRQRPVFTPQKAHESPGRRLPVLWIPLRPPGSPHTPPPAPETGASRPPGLSRALLSPRRSWGVWGGERGAWETGGSAFASQLGRAWTSLFSPCPCPGQAAPQSFVLGSFYRCGSCF